jgi:hypothetical protein
MQKNLKTWREKREQSEKRRKVNKLNARNFEVERYKGHQGRLMTNEGFERRGGDARRKGNFLPAVDTVS